VIGIYKITSPSGKVYIGQSWNIERRFKQYKKSLCAKQIKLFNSIIKYGIEAHVFEIIHEFLEEIDQQILDDHEILYWNQYKNLGIDVLNTREPGKGGKHSEETKKLMSEWQIGKVLSSETKDKISKSQIGRTAWNKGLKHSQETKDKISLANKGKKHSQEEIDKMSKALKGRVFSEETRRKISEAKKGTKYKTKL
jgi:group I intron endonuclease